MVEAQPACRDSVVPFLASALGSSVGPAFPPCLSIFPCKRRGWRALMFGGAEETGGDWQDATWTQYTRQG
jgi:hypothetical protein